MVRGVVLGLFGGWELLGFFFIMLAGGRRRKRRRRGMTLRLESDKAY